MAAPETRGARRAAVVYNPIKIDQDAVRAAVGRAEREHGWAETLWLETSEEDPGGGQTREAVDAGVDVVIAAGGDGTVRAVAEALRDADTALALLPSGTGNLLARNLNLDLDHIEGSVETAFTGHDERIDLGIARLEREDGTREEHAFLVMAGIGIDAQMVVNTNPELKKKVGWLAYVDAIIKSLRDRDRIRVRYEIDDQPVRGMGVHTLMVGNCGSLPGNILLLPEAAVDDGFFDIVALRPEGFIGWVQIWTKIIWENGVLRRSQVGRKLIGLTKEVRTLRYLKGATFTARLDRPDEFELDGDVFGEVIAFRTTVDPLALRVRIPEGRTIDSPRHTEEPADAAQPQT
ncbi:diacylglycerol/lipid kinase family protein [Homoserinibacter sp. YIM 151385]|uniref:diacylglycerol/lipid kinase family protein n=1 Tax=Homoserinibacter sp. YIM 151385 TaxID=2985506 RepID=UPI0022F07AB7|nr:diacylglycerol kinase family protein [Homoserinibacter sp. YIM 151385]WBU37113.1 diacylglycerol kinase family protein [Homoserinibacter sp. YIM 151385]